MNQIRYYIFLMKERKMLLHVIRQFDGKISWFKNVMCEMFSIIIHSLYTIYLAVSSGIVGQTRVSGENHIPSTSKLTNCFYSTVGSVPVEFEPSECGALYCFIDDKGFNHQYFCGIFCYGQF